MIYRDFKMLVIADLHLGIESELAEAGVSLPSQLPDIKRRINQLLDRYRLERVLLLGDVKHNVPRTAWLEWQELPEFFEELLRKAEVEVILGNHDGDLEGMVPRGVRLHSASGIKVGEVGFIHGHAWPSSEVLNCKVLVMGHMHPAFEFKDAQGGRKIEPAWLKGSLHPQRLPPDLRFSGCPEVIILPSFSRVVRGSAVNLQPPDELIGPLIRSGALNWEELEAYLLDGTYLGRIGQLLSRDSSGGRPLTSW